MFVLSAIKTRYYDFQAPDNKKALHIEPPKLKTLKLLESLNRPDASLLEMTEVVAKILTKNKEGRRITAELVCEWMNTDQLTAFISDFCAWLTNERETDPN